MSWWLARWLIVTSPIEHADALVVLSGSENYLERARWAAQLFKENRADKIILTNDGSRGGWSNPDQRNLFFFEASKRELEKNGVPPDRITVLTAPVSSTQTEALEVRKYIDDSNTNSVLIVTSPYHSRRVSRVWMRVFQGAQVSIGIDCPPPVSPAPAWWWLTTRGWRNVGGEFVKLIWYRFAY